MRFDADYKDDLLIHHKDRLYMAIVDIFRDIWCDYVFVFFKGI